MLCVTHHAGSSPSIKPLSISARCARNCYEYAPWQQVRRKSFEDPSVRACRGYEYRSADMCIAHGKTAQQFMNLAKGVPVRAAVRASAAVAPFLAIEHAVAVEQPQCKPLACDTQNFLQRPLRVLNETLRGD